MKEALDSWDVELVLQYIGSRGDDIAQHNSHNPGKSECAIICICQPTKLSALVCVSPDLMRETSQPSSNQALSFHYTGEIGDMGGHLRNKPSPHQKTHLATTTICELLCRKESARLLIISRFSNTAG